MHTMMCAIPVFAQVVHGEGLRGGVAAMCNDPYTLALTAHAPVDGGGVGSRVAATRSDPCSSASDCVPPLWKSGAANLLVYAVFCMIECHRRIAKRATLQRIGPTVFPKCCEGCICYGHGPKQGHAPPNPCHPSRENFFAHGLRMAGATRTQYPSVNTILSADRPSVAA